MEMNPYIVYVKTDDANRITAVNSSAFLRDTDGWTKIAEGYGDKHRHAQGNYFDQLIMDDRGIWRYKLVDGKAVERTQEEMDADYTPPEAGASLDERVNVLEEALDMILTGVTE